MKKLTFLLNLFMLLSSVSLAQTNISGIISSDTTWTLADSPYTILGDIGVSSGTTLTIESGVIINFSGDYRILVKGNLLSSGKIGSLITFNGNSVEGNNNMIIFKSTNLSNSTITYNKFIGPQKSVQLAEESEGNQDTVKNSGDLTVKYSEFIDSGVFTKGYGSTAELKFENSIFENSLIKGYYPRSEIITLTNSIIKNSEIFSDSYNKGIKIDSSLVTDSQFKLGCCGSNFIIENSILYSSPFSQTNSGGNATLNKSLVVDSPFIGSGTLTLLNTIVSFSDSYTPSTINNNTINSSTAESGIKTTNITMSNSGIYGCKFGEALNISSSNNNTINKSTFINNNTDIIISGSTGSYEFSENNFLYSNELYRIYNTSTKDINAINNYWGTSTESEISSLIFDSSDDIDKGTVSYSPFVSTHYLLAPISPPSDVTKIVSGSDVVLNWSANGESDLAGYKLHYVSPTGYSYSTTVDLGNVTTYTVIGGDISTEYAITAYDTSLDGIDDMVDGNESWFSVGKELLAGEEKVTLSSSGLSISEPSSLVTLTATLDNISSDDVVVNLSYSGTATNTTDYSGASSIIVSAGSLTGTITITALDDTEIEVIETIIINVGVVTGGYENGIQQVTINLTDDDGSGVSGIISSDTTWTLADSPYTILGDIGVSSGTTLTIESGVIINFSGDYRILVKGNLLSSGKIGSLITFNGNSVEGNNNMIIFKSTNLSNSTITYNKFIGPQKSVQLAEESEGNQDTVKNSGDLTVKYSEFIDSGVFTKGYGSTAELKFENSIFENSLIKGYYPRSEIITLTNSIIKNSEIFSDSYNKGIKIDSSLVTDSQFKLGCCGSNFIIENSILYSSPFSQTNSGGNATLNKSLVVDSPFIGSGTLTLLNTIVSFSDSYTPSTINNNTINSSTAESGIKTTNITMSNSGIYGCKFGEALNISSSNNNTINKSTFINNNTDIIISGSTGSYEFSENNFLYSNELYRIYNTSTKDINAINNYWGTSTESEISSLIFDSSDDIDKGTVSYSPFVSTHYLLAPISPPSDVTKIVSGSDVVLNWSANGESDLAGYKLHYVSPTGYSYSTTVDLGNVTTYTVIGGDISTEYAITAYDTSLDGIDDMVDGNESWFSVSSESATLSLNDLIDLKELKVYPNPANIKLNIKLINNLTFIKGEIYNTLGQIILETREASFSIENLPSSIYFIKIFTLEGVTTRRFIKK